MPRKLKEESKNASYPGKALHAIYRENGFNLEEVADSIGIARQTLGKYMSGAISPPADILGKLADYFNVTTDYLLGRTQNKTVDADLQAACKTSGLSEKAIKQTLINHYTEGGEVLNAFLETSETYYMLHKVYKYLQLLKSEYQDVNEEIKQASHILSSAGYFYVTPQYAAELEKQIIVQDFAQLLDIISDRDK